MNIHTAIPLPKFAHLAGLTCVTLLLALRSEAATLTYANDWNYNVPTSGVTLSGTNYFASTTDLANAGQSTLASAVWSGGTNGDFGSSPAQLNNGLYAPAYGPDPAFVDAAPTDSTLLATPGTTYTINFSTGMDLTSLDVYSAMTGTTRAKQNWSLAYRLAGEESYQNIVDPFLPLNVAQNSNGNRQGAWYNKVTLSLSLGELSNVDSLRFTFLTPSYWEPTDGPNSTMDPTGYREIDVFGDYGDYTWSNAAGDMTWNTSSTNWTAGGSNRVWQNPKAATLGAAGAGTITVAGTNTVNGLTVTADGYTLSGGQINLGLGSTILAISNAAAIESVVGGTNSLVKSGGGTLTFAGATANTYSGSTTVRAGTLQLNKSAGTTAIAADVSVTNGATLLISASEQVADGSAVTLSGGTIAKGSGAITETFGALNLTGASFLDFGTGTGNFTFASYTPGGFQLTFQNFNLGNSLTFSSGTFVESEFDFNGFGYSLTEGTGFTITAIPEPSTVLAAIGLAGLMLWPVRKRLMPGARLFLSRAGSCSEESRASTPKPGDA